PNASVSGNPIMSDTPKPVTDSMNGTTPLAIISADPSDAPPAANQSASCRCAPVRSMTRASVTPPPIIASTLSSVPKDPPTASGTSASGASSTANPTMSAPIIPATGGTQAGNRDSKSATTTNSGTAASTTVTSLPTFTRSQHLILRSEPPPGGADETPPQR